jgi:hypothetical protein
MRKALLLSVVVGSFAMLGMGPAAAKPHIQNISQQSAEAMCKHHGGGTDCYYCDPRHCHFVGCGDKGKGCFNFVDPAKGRPSGIRTGVGNVKGEPTTNGHKGLHHPVDIGSGVKPVVNSPVASGAHGGGMTGGHGGGIGQGQGHHH